MLIVPDAVNVAGISTAFGSPTAIEPVDCNIILSEVVANIVHPEGSVPTVSVPSNGLDIII